MTNQDQAARVIRTWQQRHKNAMDDNPDWAAQNLAIDLHNAGLLTPDSDPATTKDAGFGRTIYYWEGDGWRIGTIGEPQILTRIPEKITPTQAQQIAAALIAAANHQEEA